MMHYAAYFCKPQRRKEHKEKVVLNHHHTYGRDKARLVWWSNHSRIKPKNQQPHFRGSLA